MFNCLQGHCFDEGQCSFYQPVSWISAGKSQNEILAAKVDILTY